ncbi:hypothetical protein F2P81_008269 [Scophthalmus maximus]|uniref:Uncharacterized protein n=1 Tax=Scophthalmus maximus TaxID=52904 RepID=A0A6A4TA50_SCOMX|nr:hypothetical protein F2P81_008269 [Scophthalmus maximus]
MRGRRGGDERSGKRDGTPTTRRERGRFVGVTARGVRAVALLLEYGDNGFEDELIGRVRDLPATARRVITAARRTRHASSERCRFFPSRIMLPQRTQAGVSTIRPLLLLSRESVITPVEVSVIGTDRRRPPDSGRGAERDGSSGKEKDVGGDDSDRWSERLTFAR